MKILNSKMKFQVALVGPEDAQKFLDKNHPKNRRPKKGKIIQMRRDQIDGLWELTHQPIAFDEDGYLIDGQNRLASIIQSGMEVPLVIAWNVPRRAMLGADSGSNRTVTDVAQIMGDPMPRDFGYASTARRMFIGNEASRTSVSIPRTLAFIKRHRQALDFVYSLFHKNHKGLTQAPVKAVIARAWYTKGNRERLKQFAEILISGLVHNIKTDGAAIMLRNWLLNKLTHGKRGLRANPPGHLIYAKVESALAYFLEGENPDKLYGTKEELFPIPEDDTEEEEAA